MIEGSCHCGAVRIAGVEAALQLTARVAAEPAAAP